MRICPSLTNTTFESYKHTFKVDCVPIPTYGCLGKAYWVKDCNLEDMLSLSLSLHTGVCT